jgi:hypothetical protein
MVGTNGVDSGVVFQIVIAESARPLALEVYDILALLHVRLLVGIIDVQRRNSV